MASETLTFRWYDVFLGDEKEAGWQHSGIDLLDDGRLVFAAPDGSTLTIQDLLSGKCQLIKTELSEMHDVVNAKDGIWICDIGHRYVSKGKQYVDRFSRSRVVKIDLQGKITQELLQPNLENFKVKGWSPTGITVAPNGDIWVADGYSSYLILHFDSAGEFLGSFDGSKSGQAFNCPHTIRCQVTSDGYQLVIADRANQRMVWMKPDGEIMRIERNPFLTSPSGIARYKAGFLVTQLWGTLVYVGDDGKVAEVVSGLDIHKEKGWPNFLDAAGSPVRPRLVSGSLISPHGITSNLAGEIFLTQWLIGGHVLRGDPESAPLA